MVWAQRAGAGLWSLAGPETLETLPAWAVLSIAALPPFGFRSGPYPRTSRDFLGAFGSADITLDLVCIDLINN